MQPKESWTHDFCLLADPNQNITPSIHMLSQLGEAGLGKRKVVFPDKNAKFEQVKQQLEQEYPKLSTQEGAFELLRAESGGMSRPLKLIPMPSDGYSIPHLKSLVANSTLIYIRPIKSCISMEKVIQPITASSPMSKCPECKTLVPIISLREHVSSCQAISVVYDSDDDKDFEQSVFDKETETHTQKNDKKKRGACKSEVQGEPCSSSGISFIDQGIATLTRLFPDEQIDSLREALVLYEDVEMAADAISRRQDISFPKRKTHEKEKQVESDVYESLKQIRAKMKSFMSAEALKIADEEDIVFDFFRYYKSKEFDPEIPISVRYKGQPGVDSGGILRQAFTKVFKMIADNEVQGLRLFTGPSNRVTPIYSSAHILNNTFETVGKMVAHSLAQGGPGFPYLAPAVFWYLATGDLNEAVSRASCIDVVDPDLLSYLEKVKENSPISELSCDSVFICLVQECGEIRKITETNKFEIMQVLILHATVVKHKAALDQFRKGLEILGVLSEIEKAPNKYEHFFVHSEEEITADSVKNLLQMPDKLSNSVVESSVGMLNTFLEKASKEDLKSFLSFATGSQLITGALRPHCISVSVENSQGFFASTCTLELKIPADVLSYSHFELLLRSVMKGNKFTTV